MGDSRTLTAAEAVLEATDIALGRHPEAYVLGEGVADPRGIFGTTTGLVQKYGPERVVEMPVAEAGLTGIAIGSAMVGQRPIMVHQRADFALLAVEQLFNNAAKMFFVSNGKHRVPLVVRMIIGRGWGQGPAHSQSLENLFSAVPGLRVVMPVTPHDFKGMLLASVEDNNPVLFLEHRWLHYVKGHVPPGYYTVPLTEPRHAREGNDVTLVANSYGVLEALEAADALGEVGCRADVFDLRVLRPLSLDSIVASVRRTGRLVMLDTGFKTYGIGAEVVATVSERAHAALKAPPRRLGLPNHPTPSSRGLSKNFYPGSVQIMDAVHELIGTTSTDIANARSRLARHRASLPSDQPNPAFQGPF